MSSVPLVYVIILNWNGWQDTLACVASCRKLTWPNFRILVIDNGSTDGSEGILRERLANLEIIQSGANLGFAGGNNVGIRHALNAGADYVWLLNNDAEVAPEALTTLVEALATDPRAVMAASKIYFYDEPKRIWFAGGLWEKNGLRLRMLGANQVDRGQFDDLEERLSASGCSLLADTRIIEHVGLLDESYFLYWEDTEWCARTRRHNFKIIFVPTSHVWHKVSRSAGNASAAQHYYFVRNGLFFLWNESPPWIIAFSFMVALSTMKYAVLGNSGPLKGFLQGWKGFLAGERGQRTIC